MRVLLLLLACISLVAPACAPSSLSATPTQPSATSASEPQGSVPAAARARRTRPQASQALSTVRIGAALSLSGPARLFGSAQRNGIELARDEINASHMLGNTRLEVHIEDDASDREQGSAVFQRLIEGSHVLAIIGPTLSDTALTVDPIAQQAGVPVLAISNAAGGITQIGDFIFRASLSESQLTPQVINSIRARMKIHKAALLYSDTDPNRTGSHGFKAALQALGVRITSEQVFTPDQTDFSPQLEDIAMSRPDALFITAPSSSAASILVQWRQHGVPGIPVIGSNAFNSDTVLRNAGDAAEGLIVGSAWSAANPSARNMQFIQAYRSRYGVDPDQIAAQGYAGVYILAAAIRDAGSTSDGRAVRDALERLQPLDTPLGAFSFTPEHDANYPPLIQVVHQGKFELF